MILGFDPGRDKCGLAVMDQQQQLLFHQVVLSADALTTMQSLCQQFAVATIVMGDQTTSKSWKQKIEQLALDLPIFMVDERYSSLEARDRYWQMYPPKGLDRLIPKGFREPPRPIDDLVAILLIERYLAKKALG